MTPIAFAIVGAGWRTEFFLRIARALPDRFRVLGVVARNAEKGRALEAAWGVPTFRDIDALLDGATPAFVVVSVPQPAAPAIIADLAARRVPVLTETPPAPTLDGLLELWSLVENGATIEVAEQYIYQPLHAARLALLRSGRLGTPSFAHVSCCHGYHGTSLIRHFLGLGFEDATITARAFESDIVGGPTRIGPPTGERLARSRQVIAQLDFGDRLGVYDFAGDQYFSWIRALRVLIRGNRGEICDADVRYLEDFRTPVQLSLLRRDTGHNGNLEGYSHQGILAGSDWLYTNPFPGARLSDDELAIATVLDGMQRRVESGPSIYGFADAAQDQYLSLSIERALETAEPVRTTRQPWAPA